MVGESDGGKGEGGEDGEENRSQNDEWTWSFLNSDSCWSKSLFAHWSGLLIVDWFWQDATQTCSRHRSLCSSCDNRESRRHVRRSLLFHFNILFQVVATCSSHNFRFHTCYQPSSFLFMMHFQLLLSLACCWQFSSRSSHTYSHQHHSQSCPVCHSLPASRTSPLYILLEAVRLMPLLPVSVSVHPCPSLL